MTQKTFRWLGVDVVTADAKRLLRRLISLKTTAAHNGPYPYNADPTYSQIRVQTSKTEKELEDWLYQTRHGAEYVGVFDAEPPKPTKENLF